MTHTQSERNIAANRARRFLQHTLDMDVMPEMRDTGKQHGPVDPWSNDPDRTTKRFVASVAPGAYRAGGYR